MCYKVLRTCGSFLVVVAALGIFGCATADFCVHGNKPTLPSIDVVYAGKAFAVPAPGQCAPWMGFCKSGCSPDNVQTGTACTASNGSHVSFGITTVYLASNRQWDWIRLDLPGLTGAGNMNNFQEGIAKTADYNASAVACNPSVVLFP